MNVPIAMISSTVVDLGEHRIHAREACLNVGVFPNAMEQLPASDATAIKVSLEMVDRADIYLGIYGWRYGYVPAEHDVSITEMELDRALLRKIPILIFLIHDDHLLTKEMVEADRDAQLRLEKLKKKATTKRTYMRFRSPAELRANLIQSLSSLINSQHRAPVSLYPPGHMGPAEVIDRTFVKVESIAKAGVHAPQARALCQELLKPLFDELLQVHRDYAWMFTSAIEMLPSIDDQGLAEYTSGLRDVATFLRAKRIAFAPTRVRLRTMADTLSKARLWDPAKEFVDAIVRYFPASDVPGRSSAASEVLERIGYWDDSAQTSVDDKLVSSCDIRELLEQTIQHQNLSWRKICEAFANVQVATFVAGVIPGR